MWEYLQVRIEGQSFKSFPPHTNNAHSGLGLTLSKSPLGYLINFGASVFLFQFIKHVHQTNVP